MAAAAPTLAVLQGLIFAAARRADVPQDVSHLLSRYAIEGIIAEFGSTKVYISDGSEIRRRARDEMIAASVRGGIPLERIARQTRLSYRRVAAIVQALGLRSTPPEP